MGYSLRFKQEALKVWRRFDNSLKIQSIHVILRNKELEEVTTIDICSRNVYSGNKCMEDYYV